MSKLKGFKKQISSKDEKMFEDPIHVLKNIDFCELWKSEELSVNNKNKIWEYMQTLYILGDTIISDGDKILNIVKKFKENSEVESEGSNNEEENDNEDDEILSMLKNLTSADTDHIDENFINEGLLGNLAKELTKDIDFSVLNVEENGDFSDIFSNLLNSDNKLNFMNLVQTVGNKIQKKVEDGEFSQNDLFQDAQRMMSGLKNLQQTPEPTEPFNPTRDRLEKN